MEFFPILLIILLIILLTTNYQSKPYHSKYLVPIKLQQIKLDSDTKSLFWTGGYDSTFRLCQLLLDERKKVKPIYITSSDVDSPSSDRIQHRRSREAEVRTMKNIRKILYHDYPFTRQLLLPTLYVNQIRPNREVDQKNRYIHYVLTKFGRVYT